MESPGEPHDMRVDFLTTDLDVGITFAEIALDTDDQDKMKRNTKNAHKAYEAVLGFLVKTALTPAERATINEKAAFLKSLLERLGEAF